MTDLLAVLPTFDNAPFSQILPSLENAHISITELLTLDGDAVAKRAHVPVADVKGLTAAVISAFENNNKFCHPETPTGSISTLDSTLDSALGGGISVGHITELVGESATGKTQFLMTLLLSAQLPPPHGLGKDSLYISTEAPLQTARLAQILRFHPYLAHLNADEYKPSLSRVQSTHVHDLEAQEHILRYQVPVVIKRHDIGLIVIDSVAANYRSEFDKSQDKVEGLARRNRSVTDLSAFLRKMARENNVAVIVANQVIDRFEKPQQTPHSTTSSADSICFSTDDPISLDHQQCFDTGWGDGTSLISLKTPCLGLAWTNQLGTRIALLKGLASNGTTKRTMKIVFSAWCHEASVNFEITSGGVRALTE